MRDAEMVEIRREFSRNTSCHGLAQVYASTGKYQKIFWLVLTMGVFILLISQLAIRIEEYTAHKTTTSISEIYTGNMTLPSITICNFNTFFGVESREEQIAINELAKARRVIAELRVNYSNLKFFDDHYDGSIRKYAIAKGWELNSDTLVWCYSGENTCTAENFTYTITDLGKCWTFKHPVLLPQAGSKHGLSIVLDVGQDGYTESPLNGRWEAGIKVQVHPAHDVPEVDQFGLAVPVGFMGFLAIQKKEEKIMYKPWGECSPSDEDLQLFDTYSRPNCMRECRRGVIEIFCQCLPYTYENLSNVRECNPRETVSCLWDVSTKLNSRLTLQTCQCQPPCESTEYYAKISYATLPNKPVWRTLSSANNWTSEYARENLVGVNIFFERMSYTKQVESMAITFSGLLSDLGGQLGLWVGISVVTIFEFVQFFIFCCARGAEVARKRKRDNHAEESENQDSRNTEKVEKATEPSSVL